MNAGGCTISISPGASHDKVRINVTTLTDTLANQLSKMHFHDSLDINVTVLASPAVEESALGSVSKLIIDCFPDGFSVFAAIH